MSKFIFLKSLRTILEPLKRLIDRKAENVSWNENDPSSKGYIAGRTHYKEEKNVNYIKNEQVSFTNRDGTFVANVTRLNASVGDTLTVVWDGVEYECKITLLNGAYILGNGSIVFGAEVENTGEPFLWGYNDEFSQIYTLDTAESHTVSCYGVTTVIHKLPNEYLPDMVGKNGRGKNAEIFNDYTNNTATGDYAHAEGSGTSANASHAHAEGYKTEALSQYSHTEGYYTFTQDYAAHAEGEWTYANGRVSHAEGSNTRANSPYQHVQGKYNVEDWTGKYAHIVGNGSSSKRKNAHTLDWDGLGWFAGGLKVGGTGQDDENAEAVATNAYVDEKIASIQDYLPKITTITISAADWVGDNSPYSQDIVLNCTTENSMVNLQPTPEQLAIWQDEGFAFTTYSNNGSVSVYVTGGKPTEDYTVQAIVQKVLEV